jgi:hypothetical protein
MKGNIGGASILNLRLIAAALNVGYRVRGGDVS